MTDGIAPRRSASVLGLRVTLALLVLAYTLFGVDVRAHVANMEFILLVAGALTVLGLGVCAGTRTTAHAVALAFAAGDLLLATAAAAVTGGALSPCVVLLALPVLEASLAFRLGGVFVGVGAVVSLFVLSLTSHLASPRNDMESARWLAALALESIVLLAIGLFAVRQRDAQDAREQELAVARRRLRSALVEADAILENMSSGIVTVGTSGRLVHVNPAAATILGVSRDDLRGHPYRQILTGGLAPLAVRLERALFFGVIDKRAEMDIARSDERIPVGISTCVLRDEDGHVTGALAIFQDLTRAREMEERARRRETLAAIGELTAGIAHEIRNCLHPISGSVDVLRREFQPTGVNAQLMDLIARDCDRLNAFVGDLLSYGREKPLSIASVDLRALLADAIAAARHHPAMHDALTIQLVSPDTVEDMHGDPGALRQVLLNLLVNALEATPAGGSVTVTLTPADAPGGEVTIEVRDTGTGITPDDLQHVCQPFFTTKKAGTGLGLAIATRIVERHGGHLDVDSRVGDGTIVRLVLPTDAQTTERAA